MCISWLFTKTKMTAYQCQEIKSHKEYICSIINVFMQFHGNVDFHCEFAATKHVSVGHAEKGSLELFK